MKLNIKCEYGGDVFLHTNIYKKLFSKYTTLNINNECDLVIKSCLSGCENNDENKPYIYWSGENRIPNKSKYETFSISFSTTITDNSIYIPFCLESNHIYKDRLYSNNYEYILGYCASNPVPIREETFNKFVEKIGIDNCVSFGSCYGKYKETNKNCGGDFQGLSLINNYSKCKFVLAMENSIGPGYITEKIINAFYSGAIPIYWGATNINDFFNKDAFININDFNNIDNCIDYIMNLSDDQINNMKKQNIYTDNELINIFNDNYNKKNKILEKYDNEIKNFISQF